MRRFLRHVIATPAGARRAFPRATLDAIERAIRESEQTHAGQIRFAIEAALDIGPLLAGQSARERAIDVFSELRIWDTEHNNGVLLYLLLADRDVEIVADRGVARRVPEQDWSAICARMESALAAGRYRDAVVQAIREISEILARLFPARAKRENALPDRPVLLN